MGQGSNVITFGALSAKTYDQVSTTVERDSFVRVAGYVYLDDPPVCTAGGTLGATITFVSGALPGTCTIDANQAGNTDYPAATMVARSFTVGLGVQTINFTSHNPSPATVGGSTYTVTATGGGSGNAVTFALDGTSSGCAFASPVVTFTAAGTCIVDANQAGTANTWAAAPLAQQIITVG